MSEVQENDWSPNTSSSSKSDRKCRMFTDCFSRHFYTAKGFLTFLRNRWNQCVIFFYFSCARIWHSPYKSIYIFFQSLVASGYTASVATSIEQRYSLKATEIGAIVASCDIGSLSTVVFVSWLGGSGNRPRWVAMGGILVAIGSGLFTLPQECSIYILKPYLFVLCKDPSIFHRQILKIILNIKSGYRVPTSRLVAIQTILWTICVTLIWVRKSAQTVCLSEKIPPLSTSLYLFLLI